MDRVEHSESHAKTVLVTGVTGYIGFNWVWRIRGIADRLMCGVGMRRGRRRPNDVRIGDALDFWRVEAVEPDHLLRLRAEMKRPGVAWLQFKSEPLDNGTTHLAQEAFFRSQGTVRLALLVWSLSDSSLDLLRHDP
jgi:nucleoside-diphosphate-sugar epimerase